MGKSHRPYVRRKRPDHCLTCGEPATTERTISFRGYCLDCSTDAISAAGRQLQAKSGPYYDQWRESYRQSLERQLRSIS